MNRHLTLIVVCAATMQPLGAGTARAAPFVIVDADVTQGDARVTGVFTVTLEVRAGDGTSLLAESLAGLVIEDGLFSAPLDLALARTRLEGGETLTLEVDFGDAQTTVGLGPVLLARAAADAEIATTASSAPLLGDVEANDLIDATALDSVVVANANLRGVPAGIVDGVDAGNVLSLSGLIITSGLLEVQSVTSALIVDGTVSSAQLADGQFTSTQLGALDASRVADQTLGPENLKNGAFGLNDVTGTQQVFRHVSACGASGRVTTLTSCAKRPCPAGERRNCSTALCEVGGSGTTCATTPIGRLLQ